MVSPRVWDLVSGLALTVAAMPAILFDVPFVRVVLGAALALAIPGYAASCALFPDREGARIEGLRLRALGGIERAGVSLVLSMFATGLAALVSSLLPGGLDEPTVAWNLGGLSLLAHGFAWVARSTSPLETRFEPPGPRLRLEGPRAAWILAGLGVLTAGGAVAWTMEQDDGYTAYYLLGPTGAAACYPDRFENATFRTSEPGCPAAAGNLTLALTNHEGHRVSYRIEGRWVQDVESPEGVLIGEWTATLPSVAALEPMAPAPFTAQHLFAVELTPPPGPGVHHAMFRLFDAASDAEIASVYIAVAS